MMIGPDKLTCQKQIRECERRRNAKRRELFDAQDAIDQQREELIGKIERHFAASHDSRNSIRYQVDGSMRRPDHAQSSSSAGSG